MANLRFCFCLLILVLAVQPLSAQQPLGPQQNTPVLAPGVLTVIPPSPTTGETFSGPLPLVELVNTKVVNGKPEFDWTPNFEPKTNTLRELAKKITLRRDIWNLEFAFKPLRMIEVDVPQPSGKMQRKLIWYLVYRVRYAGYELQPEPKYDDWQHATFPTTRAVNRQSRRFFPSMVLQSHEFGKKQYLDRLNPAAVAAIEKREMKGGKLYDSVEITKVPIPLSLPGQVGRDVWGVATWEDVDPRIDYLSVFVEGLTNAYRFADQPGGYQPGAPAGTGRQYAFKTLRLVFWRPGDTEDEHEKEVSFGVPIFADQRRQERVLNQFGWYGHFVVDAGQGPVAKVTASLELRDAMTIASRIEDRLATVTVDPADLSAREVSDLRVFYSGMQRIARSVKGLDGPSVPITSGGTELVKAIQDLRQAAGTMIRDAFAAGGVNLSDDIRISRVAELWVVSDVTARQQYRCQLEADLWDYTKEGIEFKRRLDHTWVYR